MTPRRRRRRALVLLSLALACGGLAASGIQSRERQVEAAVGRLVPALVTTKDVHAGARLRAGQLAGRQGPSRFVPRDALAAPSGGAEPRPAPAPAGPAHVTGPGPPAPGGPAPGAP